MPARPIIRRKEYRTQSAGHAQSSSFYFFLNSTLLYPLEYAFHHIMRIICWKLLFNPGCLWCYELYETIVISILERRIAWPTGGKRDLGCSMRERFWSSGLIAEEAARQQVVWWVHTLWIVLYTMGGIRLQTGSKCIIPHELAHCFFPL